MQESGANPKHIGIIMDGNGRWAKQRGLERKFGHREGAKTFQKMVEYCYDLGIPYLTFYAWSTENWARPKEEVDAVMDLLRDYLNRDLSKIREEVRMRFIGNREALPEDIQEKMAEIEEKTAHFTHTTVNLAVNYGGRAEIAAAARRLAARAAKGELNPADIDELMIGANIDTAGQPDPDMILRPSGEQRSSNFLLWQGAYAEMVYMDVLWPDFTKKHMDEALAEFRRRNRRFGGI